MCVCMSDTNMCVGMSVCVCVCVCAVYALHNICKRDVGSRDDSPW